MSKVEPKNQKPLLLNAGGVFSRVMSVMSHFFLQLAK